MKIALEPEIAARLADIALVNAKGDKAVATATLSLAMAAIGLDASLPEPTVMVNRCTEQGVAEMARKEMKYA